jgi:hypothetical protein
MSEKINICQKFQFLILNQGASYLSIFKLLAAEAYVTYSTLIKILLEY